MSQKGKDLLRQRPKTTVYEPKPWERAVKESHWAYSAFREYLDLPLGDEKRTVANLARKIGRPYDYMKRIARINDWNGRAAAWDAYLTNLADKARTDEITKMVRRHAAAGARMTEIGEQWLEEVDVAELAPSDAIKLLKTGVDIERKALGLDGAQAGGGSNTLTIKIVEEGSPGVIVDAEYSVIHSLPDGGASDA